MDARTKSRLITIAIIAAIVLLWLWLRRIPAVQQAVQQTANNLGLPDVGSLLPLDTIDTSVPDVDGGDYISRDNPLPVLNDTSDRYSPCNFCLQSRVTISTPSPAKVIPPVISPTYFAAPRAVSRTTWNQPAPAEFHYQTGYMGGV